MATMNQPSQNLSPTEASIAHANELYEQVKKLTQDWNNVDDDGARKVIELAEDAIKEFGSTNQDKKVELRKIRAEAEKRLPPGTFEELKKRGESHLLQKYLKNKQLRKYLPVIVIFFIVVPFFGSVIEFIQTQRSKAVEPQSQKEQVTQTKASETSSPGQGMVRPANSNSIESVLIQPVPNINVINEGFRPDDPNFDNTPKFDELLGKIRSVSTIYFPSGAYYFNSEPKLITNNVVIIGDGINATSFIRNYNASDFNDVLIHTRRTITIEKISIIAASGTSRGGAIRIEGESSNSSALRELYITGQTGGTFEIPLTLWSDDRKGIRDCKIDKVEISAATHHVAWFVNVRGLTAEFNAYPDGGTTGQVTIQGFKDLMSDNIQIETSHLVLLKIYDSNNITLNNPSTEVLQDAESKNIMQNGELKKPRSYLN